MQATKVSRRISAIRVLIVCPFLVFSLSTNLWAQCTWQSVSSAVSTATSCNVGVGTSAPDQLFTVNGISPGPIGTDMNLALMNNPEAKAQFLASLPVGRWGKVEEIGALACYLCSEAAGFITGTDILIDGGWTAR